MSGPLDSARVPTAAVVGGTFNASAPIPVDGQSLSLQQDANGNLLVNIAAGGGSGSNAAAGPTGAPVPADADYIGVNIGGTLTGVTGFSLTNSKAAAIAIVDGSGNQITSFGGGTQYSDGTTQATPTGTVAIGKNPSNVLHALSLDASGNLNVNINANSFGTVTVSGTVTANQGTSPWVDNLTQVAGVALGATAVTNFGTAPAATAVPGMNASLYAGTKGLVADASGFLEVNIAAQSLGTVAVSGTVTSNQGGAPWTVKPDGTSWTLTGSSANVNVTNNVGVTQQTTPWVDNITQIAGVALGATAVTAFGAAPAAANVEGVNASLYAGTKGLVADASGFLEVNIAAQSLGTVAVSGTVTSNQGSPNTLANAWPEKITDGINGPVAVKPSLLQALPSDPAMVVAMSPNTPVMVANNPADSFLVTLADTDGNPVAVADNALDVRIREDFPVLIFGNKTNNSGVPSTNNVGALDAVANAATQTWVEGNQVLLSTDLNGGLRTMAGTIPETTAAWTSATAGNTALQVNCYGYTTVIVTLAQGSTITGGVVTFEASDTTAFTNAYVINGQQLSGPTGQPASTYTLQATTNTSWIFSVAGWAAFRVRLSTVISGTATVNVGISTSAQPYIAQQGVTLSSSGVRVQSLVGSITFGDNLPTTSSLSDSAGSSRQLAVADAVYGGAFSGTANAALSGWSKMRTPTVFKTVTATASGNTAIWTPGSGNKFRLLKFQITVPGNAAFASTAGTVTVTFQDASTGLAPTYIIFVPLAAAANTNGVQFNSGLVDLGAFGILSAAANNALNVNLSLGGTGALSGGVVVNVMGTEE